ncbi:MAG: hypothetical protein K8T89_02080 [Planctomycetes bacterium]|nr:hypothetical protein [Planctomycetota bacterium]
MDDEEFRDQGWPTRWVNRGGGCLLSAPGQIAFYPILALDHFQLNVQQYLDRLHTLMRDALTDLDVPAELHPQDTGVWVADRRVAHIGIAVTNWIAYFGGTLNVEPNLKLFRQVSCDGEAKPMTSVERERRLRIRPATVRQRLLEGFTEAFGFDRVSLFHHHPALPGKAPVHAVATRPG